MTQLANVAAAPPQTKGSRVLASLLGAATAAVEAPDGFVLEANVDILLVVSVGMDKCDESKKESYGTEAETIAIDVQSN
jgi:hypothetical protein